MMKKKAIEFVDEYKEDLIGMFVNTLKSDYWPGGLCVITKVYPTPPNVNCGVMTVKRLADKRECHVFGTEKIFLIFDSYLHPSEND